MISKDELTELQQQKLEDIVKKGYLERVPEDRDGAIQYIEKWQMQTEKPTPKKEVSIDQRLAKKQKELAKLKEKEIKIQTEIDELTLKKIDDFKTHLSDEDYKLFMEFKKTQKTK